MSLAQSVRMLSFCESFRSTWPTPRQRKQRPGRSSSIQLQSESPPAFDPLWILRAHSHLLCLIANIVLHAYCFQCSIFRSVIFIFLCASNFCSSVINVFFLFSFCLPLCFFFFFYHLSPLLHDHKIILCANPTQLALSNRPCPSSGSLTAMQSCTVR